MSASPSNPSAVVWPIFVMALGTFVLGLTEFSSMSMLPLIAETYAVTPSMAGNVISCYAIGVVIGAPSFMLLTNKTNRRTSLIIFAAMMCIANGLVLSPQACQSWCFIAYCLVYPTALILVLRY